MKNYEKMIFSFGVFLVSFIAYLITLCPTVTFTDNGELVSACTLLGVAHPSGYPLFTIFGHIWSMLPLPFTKIYHMNLLAAVYASLSVVVFFYLMNLILDNYRLVSHSLSNDKKSKDKKIQIQLKEINFTDKQKYIISFITSLILAFSNTLWAQATSLEVYGLHLLLFELTVYFAIKGYFYKSDNSLNFILSGLFLGFAFANHLTTVLLLPGLIFIFFKNQNKGFNFSKTNLILLVKVVLVSFIGISLYIYLPLISKTNPVINWGFVDRGFDKFLYHVQGKQYQTWMFSGQEIMFANIGKFFMNVPANLGYLGAFASLFGIYLCYKNTRNIFWFFIITFVSVVLYSSNYSIHDIDVYFLTALMILVLFAGISFTKFDFKKNAEFLPLIIVVISLLLNFNKNDESQNYLVHDFTKNVLDNVAPNAIIISAQYDYWVAPSIYFQKVMKYRTDVTIIDKELLRRTWYPFLIKNWYPQFYDRSKNEFLAFEEQLENFEKSLPESTYPFIQPRFEELLKSFISRNINDRPIYITYDVYQSENYLTKNFQLIPEGFTFRIFNNIELKSVNLDKIRIDRIISGSKGNDHHLVVGLKENTAFNILNLGIYAQSTNQIDKAKQAYEMVLKLNPNNEIATQRLQQIMK